MELSHSSNCSCENPPAPLTCPAPPPAPGDDRNSISHRSLGRKAFREQQCLALPTRQHPSKRSTGLLSSVPESTAGRAAAPVFSRFVAGQLQKTKLCSDRRGKRVALGSFLTAAATAQGRRSFDRAGRAPQPQPTQPRRALTHSSPDPAPRREPHHPAESPGHRRGGASSDGGWQRIVPAQQRPQTPAAIAKRDRGRPAVGFYRAAARTLIGC